MKTVKMFLDSLKKIEKYEGKKEQADEPDLEDLTKDWLSGFQKWMLEKGCTLNTCNIYFRSLSAVKND